MFSFFFFFNDTATTEIYTLSLHDALPIYFDDQRGHARRKTFPEMRHVVQPHEPRPGEQRLERLAILFRPGQRKRAERPPVERILEGKDFKPLESCRGAALARVSPRQFDRPFDDLGAGVRQKDAVQARLFGQLLRQRSLVAVVEDRKSVV